MDPYATTIGHQLAWLDHHYPDMAWNALMVNNAWHQYTAQFPQSQRSTICVAYVRAYISTRDKLRRQEWKPSFTRA